MMFSLYIPVEDSDEETKIKLFPTLLLLKKKRDRRKVTIFPTILPIYIFSNSSIDNKESKQSKIV